MALVVVKAVLRLASNLPATVTATQKLARESFDERQFRFGLRLSF